LAIYLEVGNGQRDEGHDWNPMAGDQSELGNGPDCCDSFVVLSMWDVLCAIRTRSQWLLFLRAKTCFFHGLFFSSPFYFSSLLALAFYRVCPPPFVWCLLLPGLFLFPVILLFWGLGGIGRVLLTGYRITKWNILCCAVLFLALSDTWLCIPAQTMAEHLAFYLISGYIQYKSLPWGFPS